MMCPVSAGRSLRDLQRFSPHADGPAVHPPPMNCNDFPSTECPGCCRAQERRCEQGCGLPPGGVACKATCRQQLVPCKAACPHTTGAFVNRSVPAEHSEGDGEGGSERASESGGAADADKDTTPAGLPAVVFTHGGSERQMYAAMHYCSDYAGLYALNQYFACVSPVLAVAQCKPLCRAG